MIKQTMRHNPRPPLWLLVSLGGLLALLGQACAATDTKVAGSGRSGLGLNLGHFSYYAQDTPTIDLMKRAGPWLTQCALHLHPGCKDFSAGARDFDTLEEAHLDLDANGWVRSLPAAGDTKLKYRRVMSAIASGGIPAGNYTVLYDGAGTITYSGVGRKVAHESRPGRDIVAIAEPDKGDFFIAITATDPANHIRNVRILPPGGACGNDLATFAALSSACGGPKGAFVPFEKFPQHASTWHPAYLKDLQRFRTLRFMDWAQTNTAQITSWAQRPQLNDRSWAGSNGAPVETIFDLANKVGADPWVTLPPKVDDDYVRQFARLARERLAPGLGLNLEYANEAWNYGFKAAHWMLAQAKTTWPDEVAKGTNVYVLQANWYAKRLAEVCQLTKAEFGAQASRVRCIFGAQAAGTWTTEQGLICSVAARTLGQACSKFIDVLAVAPYFGHYVAEPKFRATILGWYTEPDGGLGKLFAEIQPTAGSPAPLARISGLDEGALGGSRAWMAANQQLAKKYGLPLWAYEAGQHLVPAPNETDDKLLNLMITANRDARMQAAYTRYFADWQAAGGQTMAMYAHLGRPSKWGMWGLKENQFNDNAPKWQAVLQQRDQMRCWWPGC